MPTYQFKCRSCGDEFDRFRLSTQSNHPVECPTCKGDARKVFCPGCVNLSVPKKFKRHIEMTGLKSEMGSGPGLDANVSKTSGTRVAEVTTTGGYKRLS